MRVPVVALVLCLALTGCQDGEKAEPDATLTPSITDTVVVKGQSHAHFQKKSDFPHTYPQVPPVGGPHAGAWISCNVYTSPLPDEFAVHSMEHGGIWITYQPTLPAAQVATLAALQPTNKEYVLVSPYEGLPAPVVVSTWALQLKLQSADDPRLRDFITTYAGGDQGGEQGASCQRGGITPDQAAAYIASLKD